MPLQAGKSRRSIQANIKTEMAAGKPQDQAVATALNTAHTSGANTSRPRRRKFQITKPPEKV